MKKNLILISILLIFLMNQNRVLAIDDWSSIYESHKEAEYGKTVTQGEFQNAIEAYKDYTNKKTDKKIRGKLKEKGLTLEKNSGGNKVIFESPASPDPLLMLPVDISHEGKLIERGFYLASPISLDNRYFIRLSQGHGKVIADVEANVFKTDNLQKIAENREKVFFEIMKNDMLKITYTNRRFILEAYLVPFIN